MLADTGQVRHDVDAERLELRGVAHPRELQQLGRVERPAAEHDLAAHRALRRAVAALRVLDPDRARAVEQDPRDERARLDVEVRSRHHRVQVGARRRQPPPAMDRAVERREPLLPEAVHIVGERVPRLLHGLEERAEQGSGRGASLEHERSGVPAHRVGPVRRERAFHALEVGQAVRVIPRLHAGIRCPPLVVERVPPLEDHAVDAARAAEHLAARVVHTAAVHVRLGLALVLPVVVLAADREGERRRHVDEDVPDVVGAPRLEHEHAVRGIRRQPVAERAAGGSAADDHEVVPPTHRVPPPRVRLADRASMHQRAPARIGVVADPATLRFGGERG